MYSGTMISRPVLRRAGFGASAADLEYYGELRFDAAVDLLVDFEQIEDDVDARIGMPGHVGVTVRGTFQPNTVINDARQRWLFRMVNHSFELVLTFTAGIFFCAPTILSHISSAVGHSFIIFPLSNSMPLK